MLHRIDNTTSSLPAEEAQELLGYYRERFSSFDGCFREWLLGTATIWPSYTAAPERRCTVWLCPISAMPTMPRT